ncbi:hypothetical protein [Syntrophomonas palmitatica]|uniref:hypothetical protein n=1 Tax=Syntrophomonas palmitatica TaxID=402877 RepID=UPI0006D28106|nr:hypothetical protein [Syntrophomonas palmitatica]
MDQGSGEKVREGFTPWGGKKRKYILIAVICLGLLALLWPVGNSKTPAPAGQQADAGGNRLDAKAEISANLESILSQIQGAGKVEVSVYLASDGMKTYASNSRDETRETIEGASGNNTKKTSEESKQRDLAVSGSSPLLIENKAPQVLGVLIVADGADSPEVSERLVEAASTLLNISPYQVSVMPRQG